MSETAKPGARLRTGAHAFWRQHCRWLLEAAGAPDAGLRADLLLAGLSAEQLQHWLRDHRLPAADLARRLAAAAERLADHCQPVVDD